MDLLKDRGSLKYRLAVSHFSMVMIPVALILLAQWAYTSLDSYRDYSLAEQKGLVQPLKQLLRFSPVLSEVQNLAEGNPDGVLEPRTWEEFDRLAEEGLMLTVLKDGIVAYKPAGLELKNNSRDMNAIEEWLFGPGEGGPLESRQYMAIPFEVLSFSDGSSGQIYIMSPSPRRPDRNAREITLLAVFAIALLINVWISYRVAQRIVKPVGLLNQATAEIARGNLEHAIEYSSPDELGQLCSSFESMRLRLNQAEKLQQHYEQNRQELLANISHDLKTPLTSIRGYVQGLQDGVANTPEKLGKYTRTIYSHTLEMERLIEDLFLFSRLDLKQLDFDLQAIDIQQYLLDCVEDKGFEMEQKGIRLALASGSAPGLLVRADGQRLKRVINNLLLNALQHRRPGCVDSSITIALEEKPGEVVISISDNGQGIPPEVLPHIFERHYRGESSRSRPSGGSGLGLAIARQIVEAHGGRIWAESPGQQGTVVCFTLPRCAEPGGDCQNTGGGKADEKNPDH